MVIILTPKQRATTKLIEIQRKVFEELLPILAEVEEEASVEHNMNTIYQAWAAEAFDKTINYIQTRVKLPLMEGDVVLFAGSGIAFSVGERVE